MKQFLFSFTCLTISFSLFAQENTYNEVSLPELMKKKQQNPNLVIVDVRSNGEYYDSATSYKQGNIGRIKGTMHIELQELRQNPDAIKQLDAYKDKDVYLICSHSYRSRAASNILLKNGFTHVNNVRGGMTEWFRRYDELSPFKTDFYETSDKYTNLSPSQLLKKLDAGNNMMLVGISHPPKFFYDSFTVRLYRYFPAFKKAVYFEVSDSLQLLEKIRKEHPKEVILFNTVNRGGAELADWLTQKGISIVSYQVGSQTLFYEYVVNKNLTGTAEKFLVKKSKISFITPVIYCNDLTSKKDVLLIDLREDSLFNKINEGTKYNFKHLKGAVNFPESKGEAQFARQFPDKNKVYILMSEHGIDGLELADALTKQGYTIQWLIGGQERFEWYMNNVESFGCMNELVK